MSTPYGGEGTDARTFPPNQAGLALLDLQAIAAYLDLREQELAAALARDRDVVDGDAASLPVPLENVGDEAQVDAMVAVDINRLERHAQELEAIAAARARLSDGSYGLCTDCGRAIGSGRLKRLPTATRCVACQAAAEHFRGGMHPSL